MRILVQNGSSLVLTVTLFAESHFRKVSLVVPNLGALDQLNFDLIS